LLGSQCTIRVVIICSNIKNNLAEFINYALQIYSNKFPIPDSATLNLAYNAIIAALSHGVIIKQQDLRKITRDISTRLHNCETENTMLKSDNASLIQQVKNLNTIKAQLEKD
jgi:DNA-binding MurR/RpiR family transcriptional regulator